MEYFLLNLLIFLIVDILLYRIKKINFFIDCIKISLPIFLIIQYLLFINHKLELNSQILIFSNYLFFLIFYYFIFIGVKKISPTLFIINMIIKKDVEFNKVKRLFLEKNFFFSRIIENLNINLIIIKKSRISLTQKGLLLRNIIRIFKNILKV